ncbi:MAG: hypothetical protein HUK26_07865, partial [Duodenibacillus sp.]|nr:hypothetical protein [Duodenibacillus sp.]
DALANAIKVAGGNQQLLSALTSQASALGQMINSFSTMVNAGNTFAGGIYEAANKEIDAEIERMRADLTTLDNLEQALKEVLHKAQSTMESINQSTDSARRKILG